jgi:hypothetical protein
LESPAGVLVRNDNGTPVTGSGTIFFSEGKRAPISAKSGSGDRLAPPAISAVAHRILIFMV